METESVDLVIVDPPYGVEWRSNQRAARFEMLVGDGHADREGIREILRDCVRVVGQNRHLYVFGPTDVVEGLKTTAPVALVWDKLMMSGGDLSAPFGPAHESISFLVSKHRHGGQAGSDAIPARIRKGTVLRANRPTGRKVRHPSEKPLALLSELIESSSRIGDVVLDPCAGIGSTGVAAIMRGRRAVLIECDEQWIDEAIRRVREAEALADRMDAA